MPADTMVGARGAPLEVGVEPAVISAALAKRPRSLARIAPRDHTPLGKNRGGTPEGEPSPPVQGAAPHPKVRRLALRLPAFHILYIFGETEKAKTDSEANHPSRFF